MKILVTGGAGFIGSNFVRYMLNRYENYEIVNLDCLTYAGNLQNLVDVIPNPRHHFVRGDIRDSDLVAELLSSGVNLVVNFAAESHVDRSIINPFTFINTNIVGTHRLLEASRQASVLKFIQVSTDEVYGSLGNSGDFTESTPLAPNSPYSASKASADMLVRAYHETYGLPVNITRCSNNYGPYQFPEKLIPLMITNALENKPLLVYGDGLNVRDWLHVNDHCSAIDLVIHRGRNGEVYNIGGNNERTNLEVVQAILSELGKSEIPVKLIEDRLGHDRRYAIDATKIRETLGWRPESSFELGIAETVRWYVEHQDWVHTVRSGDKQPSMNHNMYQG